MQKNYFFRNVVSIIAGYYESIIIYDVQQTHSITDLILFTCTKIFADFVDSYLHTTESVWIFPEKLGIPSWKFVGVLIRAIMLPAYLKPLTLIGLNEWNFFFKILFQKLLNFFFQTFFLKFCFKTFFLKFCFKTFFLKFFFKIFFHQFFFSPFKKKFFYPKLYVQNYFSDISFLKFFFKNFFRGLYCCWFPVSRDKTDSMNLCYEKYDIQQAVEIKVLFLGSVLTSHSSWKVQFPPCTA